MSSWPTTEPDPDLDPAYVADTTTALQMSILSSFHLVAVIFVGLRIYARAFVTKAFGKDDIALCLAAACSVVGWCLYLGQVLHGLGRHLDTLTLREGYVLRVCGFFLTIAVSNWGMCSLKTAIAFNLLRFCSQVWTRYRWVIWGLLGIIWAYTLTYFVFALTHCKPVSKYWDININGTCTTTADYVKYGMGNTIMATVTDVLLALAPIPVVWQVKLSIKLRLYLVAILSLGYFSVGFGVMKTITQHRFTAQNDKTYHLSVPFWGFLQLQLGIIAASCVGIRPLMTRILGLSQSGNSAPSHASKSAVRVQTSGSRWRLRSSQRNASATQGDEYDMEDGMPFAIHDGNCVQAVPDIAGGNSFYNASHDGSESEEATPTYHTPNPERMGTRILRTTKVSVKYTGAEGQCAKASLH